MSDRLTTEDIRGVYVLPPTPCLEGAGGWDAVDSVDIDETMRMVEMLVQPGVTGLGLFGTTGEGHSLLWEEKVTAAAAAVEAARGRVQIFAGATALGTREVIRQMRGLRDVGVDGVLVGLPLWQTPTIANSVGFFADLSEAVPDLAVMVYSNSWFFKSTFPPEFWRGLATRAPTVVASKNTHGFAHFEEELAAVDGRINLIPGEFGVPEAWRKAPAAITAMWSTQAALGPEPMVALMRAIDDGDAVAVEAIIADFRAVPPYVPPGAMANRDYTDDFARYNTQVAKYRLNSSGLIKAGPMRPPYTDLPDEWKAQADREIEGFRELREKYTNKEVGGGDPSRGSDYLKGIQDGRQVWLEGERVHYVGAHPRLAGFAQTLADVYDLQHDPEHHDLLTIESPTTGDRVGGGYVVPTSLDELLHRRRMIEFMMRRTGGTAGRLPEYMASILVGMYDMRHVLAEVDPAFAANVEDYLGHCRENDLSLTHGFADAPRDARLPRDQFENLRVVEERRDGLVVRGMKSVATLAPYADEYIALAPNRPGLSAAEIVYFAVPVDTPGLRTYCRLPLSHADRSAHPLSAQFDEMDAWVVFDDVFVPRDRVFYLQRTDVHMGLLNQILSLAFYHILIRIACKAEVLAGICAAISEYLGKEDQQLTQLALCDVFGYVETLRAFLTAAEQQAVVTTSGMVIPNPTQITLGRIHSVDRQPEILQTLRELSGSGILMAPTEAELASPSAGPDIERFLVGADGRAVERFRLLKLAWEYGCESFGSRQLLFEMHNAGSQLVTKQRLASTYNAEPLKRLAKDLAGVQPGET